MKPIYKAVIVDVSYVDDLKKPLLGDAGEATQVQDVVPVEQEVSCTAKATCFVGGGIIGGIFSVEGFQLLMNSFAKMSQLQVVAYSVGWSTLTSVVAYLLLSTALSCTSAHYDVQWGERFLYIAEYWFALGVFLGFCAACIATDIVLGLPYCNLVLTVSVAVFWALVMMFCSKIPDDAEEEQVVKPAIKKGTVLPIVMV